MSELFSALRRGKATNLSMTAFAEITQLPELCGSWELASASQLVHQQLVHELPVSIFHCVLHAAMR